MLGHYGGNSMVNRPVEASWAVSWGNPFKALHKWSVTSLRKPLIRYNGEIQQTLWRPTRSTPIGSVYMLDSEMTHKRFYLESNF